MAVDESPSYAGNGKLATTNHPSVKIQPIYHVVYPVTIFATICKCGKVRKETGHFILAHFDDSSRLVQYVTTP